VAPADVGGETEALGTDLEHVLHEHASVYVARLVGHAPAAWCQRLRHRVEAERRRGDALVVEVAPEEERVAAVDPSRGRLEAVGPRLLVFVVDGGARVAVAALVDALLALRGVRIADRERIEGAQAGAVVLQRSAVQHQVPEVGHEVAVSSEELVVALAAVLLAAQVGGHDVIARGSGPVELEQAAVLREGRVRQAPFVEHELRVDFEEPAYRVVRVRAATRAQRADPPPGHRGQDTQRRRRVGGAKVTAEAPVRRVAAGGVDTVDLAGPRAQGRRVGQEVNGPAESIASVLRAARSAQDLDAFEVGGTHEVQERVDPAAHGPRGVALAIHEHADLVAGQAAHEDTGDGGARALQVEADLAIRDLGHDGLRAKRDVRLVDDVHGLRHGVHARDEARLGSDRHLLGTRRRLEHDRDGDGSVGDLDRGALRLEPGGARHQQIAPRLREAERERPLVTGARRGQDAAARVHQRHAGRAHHGARAIRDGAGHGQLFRIYLGCSSGQAEGQEGAPSRRSKQAHPRRIGEARHYYYA
jgi:hypothetical protein